MSVETPEGRGTSAVTRTRIDVNGISTRLLSAGPAGAREAVVFVHGNPGSADDWERLIGAVAGASSVGGAEASGLGEDGEPGAGGAEASGAGGDEAPAAGGAKARRALAFDLPDFGETVAGEGFERTVLSYASFMDAALNALGVQRAHLVGHDFGGPIALVWAAGHVERLASVTLIDTGILPGYRWHRMARIWRTPVLGELMQAITFRSAFRRTIAAAEPRGLPRQFLDRMYDQYDRRTRRAVLELYRSTDDPGSVAAEFSAYMAPKDVPALVIWGEHDAYLPCSYATRQREAFPSADVHVLPASGHWPFVDSPEIVERLLMGFLTQAAARAPSRGGDA